METIKEHYEKVAESPLMTRKRSLQNRQIECFFSGLDLYEIFKKGEPCLDVGCGEGFLVSNLASRFQVAPYGIDISEQKEGDLVVPRVNFQTGNAEDLPFEEGFFGSCFSYFVLQYVPDKLKAVSEVHHVLKTGGIAVLDFDDAISSDGATRNGSRYTSPGLLKICANCDLSNQMKVESIPILESSGKVSRYSQRITLTKKSPMLQFPRLVDFQTATSGPPFAYSYY